MVSAAKLLTSAPGLGWSCSEHPGHLLFPMFCRFLGNTVQDLGLDTGYRGHRDLDEFEMLGRDSAEPRLRSQSVDDVVALAGIDKVEDSSARSAILKAMQKAAETRLNGVTENKRRRYYGHAASLTAACMAVDGTNNSSKWFAAIRDEYRRYSALQRELNRYVLSLNYGLRSAAASLRIEGLGTNRGVVSTAVKYQTELRDRLLTLGFRESV